MFKSRMADRVNRVMGDSILIFRCDTDGELVLNTAKSLSVHAGHKVKAPVYLKWYELLSVWLGFIQ